MSAPPAVPEAKQRGFPKGVFSGASRKGSPNKMSKAAKDNIAAVFEGLGGVEAMLAWARKHQTLFYTVIYPRLIVKGIELKAELTTPMTPEQAIQALDDAVKRSRELDSAKMIDVTPQRSAVTA